MKQNDENHSPSGTPRLMFSAADAAQLLGVSEKTIYRLCARGLLQRSTHIRHVRIPVKSLQEFCNKAGE